MFLRSLPSALLLLGLSISPPFAWGSQSLPGPVPASLIKVVDGDTLLVSAMPWPNHNVTTYVRLRGIDAPELSAKCEGIREAATRARGALARLVAREKLLFLKTISGDKYFGRVVADVQLTDGTNPATELLDAGLVRPYSGGKKDVRFCPSS